MCGVSEGESLDVAPPYDWYRANGGMLGLEPTPDWYVAHLAEWFDRARSALKPDGNVWVNIGDTYFARWSSIRPEGRQGLGTSRRVRRRVPTGDYRQEKQLLMVPARFAIAMQSRRWILRNDFIWSKPNVPPRPEKDRLRLTPRAPVPLRSSAEPRAEPPTSTIWMKPNLVDGTW